jgi:hypothetical protein
MPKTGGSAPLNPRQPGRRDGRMLKATIFAIDFKPLNEDMK